MFDVCVIGSINRDIVLHVDRFPRIGENIYVQSKSKKYGGKGANAAIASKRLDIDTNFCFSIGDDANGNELLDNVVRNGLSTTYFLKPGISTGVAYIVVDNVSNNIILVDPGANEEITGQDVDASFSEPMINSELVLIQLEIKDEAIYRIVELCKQHNKKLIIDAGPVKEIDLERLSGTYLLSPNKTELEALCGKQLDTVDAVIAECKRLNARGFENIVVKMGHEGALLVREEEVFHQAAYKVEAVDSTAAGDSFMAGLCKGLLLYNDLKKAMQYGSICGAIAVTKFGAYESLPGTKEVEIFMKERGIRL